MWKWIEDHQRIDRYVDAKQAESQRALTARKVGAKIALAGGALSRSEFVAPWVPWCDDPQTVGGRTDPRKPGRTIETSMLVPCRKCAKCLLVRQLHWTERAKREVARAKRTWFVTLTFAPTHLAGIIFESHKEKGKEELARIDAAAYRHVQRYFKRLRKHRAVFRYLAVFELGEKTSRPHYHLLLHETGERPIPKSFLETQWRSHVHARLVAKEDDGAASYVCKYATKSADIRIRPSNDYGRPAAKGETRRRAEY